MYWPMEKPRMSFLQGNKGRSRYRARRCSVLGQQGGEGVKHIDENVFFFALTRLAAAETRILT